ncbi:pyridoxal phosphate-dependent aminotransferase [Priestia megaterium]|uniref:pyridoxal phosphate-dependent aminotransferase n=1 Tax=Priestia megaterium TaxID=1404 RepID=UPI00273016A2|nr:pyridoxal phosphate-dependent aminotransferase [Priestia megaterium]MDP1471859.1 pyridoxal phosphate-dependent aminotransferase [Priestia megaterium]
MEISPSKTVSSLPDQEFSVIINKVNELTNKGIDVINVGQGNPDLPTPPHIVNSLIEAANKSGFHKYSPFRGHKFLKEAISKFYKREYDVEIDPDKEVAIFNGGKAALYAVSQSLLNPDDVALIPDPGYPEYLSGIMMARAHPYHFKVTPTNNYLPVYKDIDQEVLEQAKLLYLNYPNNPTGATANREFFNETVKVAEENNICVLHDFAYAGFGFDKQKPISFLSSPGAKGVGIEIYTLSKTYNMAGWRVAFAVGNERVIQAINAFQDHIFVSLFGAVQQAAATALESDQSCVKDLNSVYESRAEHFIQACQRELGWEIQKPQGTFYVWAKIPHGFDSFTFTELLLKEAHIAVTPGEVFGSNAKDYIRISMVTSIERLDELVKRIKLLNINFSSINIEKVPETI